MSSSGHPKASLRAYTSYELIHAACHPAYTRAKATFPFLSDLASHSSEPLSFVVLNFFFIVYFFFFFLVLFGLACFVVFSHPVCVCVLHIPGTLLARHFFYLIATVWFTLFRSRL